MWNRRLTRWAVGLAFSLLAAAVTGCANEAVAGAARSGVASFINGVFAAAVNEALSP
jgi:hypothetical protein